jgi:hypothetical protein
MGRPAQATGAKDSPLTLVPRAAPRVGPLIEITPGPEEYDQLVSDLARLRERGAPSNTAAVVAAVHAAAGGKMLPDECEGTGRRADACDPAAGGKSL